MSEQEELNLKSNEPEKVNEYKFEPIKGYPMLNWKGKRPFTKTQFYPAQKKEVFGEEVDGWINKIFWGDNLQVMSHLLKEYRGRIDLIYIDPPFDSKANYQKKIKLRNKEITNDVSSFEEKQYADIWNNDDYLQFMYERFILLKELLSPDGVICVHLDWHAVHYVKAVMDEIFGSGAFTNEIIWQKIRTKKAQSLSFGNVHDTILIYRNSNNSTFNAQYKPFRKEYIKSHYKSDENGRMFRTVSLLQRGSGPSRKFGDIELEPPANMHWIWSQERIDQAMHEDRIKFTSNGRPEKVQFLDEMKGDIVDDIWTDIFPINSQALESINYPTQKPESLLTRIIKSFSCEGDLVLDCFMGSGTTQAVAMKLGRKFIGADINLGAIHTTTKRLIQISSEDRQIQMNDEDPKYTGFEVYNVNNYDIFKNPLEAKSLLIEALEIEPTSGTSYDGVKDGYQVKVMPVNRIATREDLNELVSNFPYKIFDQRKSENPNKPVESLMLICMGHEPNLKAYLEQECGYKLEVQVIDILRDKSNLEFKRDAEAVITTTDNILKVVDFYPMNLLQKLSLQKESVSEWRELVESVMIDWNYNGVTMEPVILDIPDKNVFVSGKYEIPSDAGNIKIKITDLLSESYEEVIQYG